MREYDINPDLDKILQKLFKRDKIAYDAIINKIQEIINSENIDHYKNLRYDMKDKKSVHIMKSFVLVFSYDKSKNVVYFLDYDHHDNIYKIRH